MSNAAVLYRLECMSASQRAGFSRCMSFVRRNASQKEFFSDGLALTVSTVGTAADVVTNAAVKTYFIDASSPSTATTTAYVQMFNTSSASVTLGTTVPVLSFKLEAQKSVTLPVADGEDSFFTTAMSMAVTTTANGATASAATERPAITVLYK